jgi:hypothetical protein
MSYIRYSYLKNEKQLVVACSGGIVDRRLLISEFQAMFSHLKIETQVDVLMDVKDINLKASIEANKIYTNYFLDSKLYSNIKRIAVIADKPAQVVQTMMFIDGVKNLGTSIKVFNYETSALDWLNSEYQNKKILQVHQALIHLMRKRNF